MAEAVAAPAGSSPALARRDTSPVHAADDVATPDEARAALVGAPDGSGPAVRDPREAVSVLVHVAGSGAGSVTSSPTGVACAGHEVSCHGWFAEGTTVTLTATPSSGHAFAGWSGACSGTGPCELFIDGETTVTATFTGPPVLTYYHVDLLGSVRAITDANGDTVTRHDYFPFGESTSALDGDPRRFLGQELDAETGFDHFGARQYRNVWGRFAGVDPVFSAAAPTNPQLWNRYAYALNGPLRFTDATGLAAEDREPLLMEAYGGLTDGFPDFDEYDSYAGLFPDPAAMQELRHGCLQGPTPAMALGPVAIWAAIRIGLQRLVPWLPIAGGAGMAGHRAAIYVGRFRLSNTVANHLSDLVMHGPFKGELARPYLNSPHLIQQIMRAQNGVPDPGGAAGALRWDVAGTLRGSTGTWELVVDSSNVILHFLFRSRY